MEGLGINLGYVLVQIVSFLVMLVILRAWVYKPVLNMLDHRRKTIAQGLEDARIAEEARANAEKEAQEILTKAQLDAAERVREATARADEAARDIKAKAETEVAEIRQATSVEAEQYKTQALGELRGQVAALAIAAAQRIIGETLDERRQHALIEEFFSGVKAGKVILIEGEALSGTSAEVTSALPLTPEEQETVRNDVVGKIGSGASISFRVDPSILGGLVIRVGDKVLDGSVSGKLQGLRQSLH
ncbi:MAG: ATP synthase F0 subunit B [Chloroflexi bacterium RBG_16_48_8]|nr:MAG: ATP synthase F0 subunit B [Chloroflexi bacterium RBG_16_48_8]